MQNEWVPLKPPAVSGMALKSSMKFPIVQEKAVILARALAALGHARSRPAREEDAGTGILHVPLGSRPVRAEWRPSTP